MNKKAGFGVMMAAGMAMAGSMENERWERPHMRVGGEPRMTARQDKKAKRKSKQASRRKNRKK